ncbi:SCY1-like protein 2 isoform X2 [Halichondria panicea]|uniref:SCY1-like protein 2 isoform X2 n=1 Tax=Halichondria panicea TaxID=6063 RepID=UPI00312B4985
MSLLGKLKSAVMGNPVTREYELGKHIASAGPGLLWKVYRGIKKTTRQEVSVFMYDKKSAEYEKMPKKHREAVLSMLRKGPIQLARLKHPRLLTIQHQLEESNDTLAFVTEPVVASLANVLGQYENVPTPLPLALKEYELHIVEIQYGILQLSEALDFLHSDAKMLHGNITPESVAVTSKGSWKLMGFNFSSFSQYQSEAQVSFSFREWDSRNYVLTNPCLDYLAPEYILSKSCSETSDIFSLGILCFAVYNKGRPLFSSHNNVLSFKHNAEQISRITESALTNVPMSFKPSVRSMLAIEPAVRPDALQISKNEFFEEPAASTLKYLDMLYQRGDMEKSQFFKNKLARTLRLLPQRVVHQRVLPALAREFRNHKMVPFVLPLVLLIAEDCSIQDHETLIMPILIPALGIQNPVQVPLILLQNMEQILKKTSQDNVKAHILPMIVISLEAENSQLQELCVSILPTFANMVDYSSMKHSIIPRLTALILSSRESSLVIKCLVCLGQMLDLLDKHIVIDVLIPTLESISMREPGVLMAILGIYHETLKKKKLGIDKTMLAARVIPFLIPLSIEPTLNVKQFNQFVLVIREMLVKVETEHQTYLDHLSKMEEQTKSTVAFAREVAEQKAMDDAIDKIEDIFGADKSQHVAGTTSTPVSTITSQGGSNDLLGGLMSKPSQNNISMAESASQQSTGRVISFENQPPALEIWKSSPATLQQASSSLKPSNYAPLVPENRAAPISQNLFTNDQFSPVSYTAAQRKPQPGSRMPVNQSSQGDFLQRSSGNNLISGTKSYLSAGTNGDLLQPTISNRHISGNVVQPTKNVVVGMQTSYPQHGNRPQDSTAHGIKQQQQQPLVPMQTNSPTSMSHMGWSSSIGNVSSTSQRESNTSWPANMDNSVGLRTEQLRDGQLLNNMLGQSSPMGGVQHNMTGNYQQSNTGTGLGHHSSMNWSSNPVGASMIPQRQPDASKANPFANLSFLS